MRGDHTLEREWDRKRERGTVSFPDSPWESNTLPHVWACVWPPHTHTHTLHATCVCVHPLLVTSTLRSLNPGYTPRRLWCVLCILYDNNLFHPSKRAGHGKKGPALEALLHLLPRLSSETKSLRRHHSVVQLQLKGTGTKSLSYTTKQHCSLFSVTAHKERALSVHGGHSVYLSTRSPQMLTLFVAG